MPSKQRNFIGTSAVPATETQQLGYDSYGNLTSFKEINGITHSFMWGYKGQYPVVYMMNGVPANPSALLNETSASVITTTANSLRSTFPNAHISHYVYQPMIGLISQTNPAQIKTSFSFDGLNRLEKVFDNAGYILKAYDYQIATTVGGNNYVKEMMPRNASTTLQTGYQNVQSSFSYVDGLGRPLQVVALQAGGDGTNDIVTNATTYNGFGRVAKSYIPYPNAGNGALAPLPTSFDGDTRPYSENILFDNSPLNRLFQVMGVGMAWQTAGKTSKSTTEVSGGIRSYSVASDGSVSSGIYPANSLLKKTVTNEQGNKMVEYTDKEGRIVQKEQELNATETAKTAYIFNDIGQLSFVVQPKVYVAATSFTLGSSLFLEGCFGYFYDTKGRLVQKHIAGAGFSRMVYDKLNRVVLENDDKDLVDNFYKFTRYDVFNRVIQTGLINNIGNFSRTQLQNDFDNHTGPISEERTPPSGAGGLLLGYTNVSFPYDYTPGEGNLKTVSYYDDLLWNSETTYNFQSANAYHPQYTNVKGMMTGKLVRNLRTNTWQKMVLHYNYQGNVIQDFHLTNRNNLIRKDNQYRFNNELLKSRYVKTNSSNIVLSTKIMSYDYDHFGRKIKFKYSLNGVEKTIAIYKYDATGRMFQKLYSPNTAIGSNQTGLWTNSATWQGLSIPTISDQVTINQGHIVTIPSGQAVSAGSLFDNGILRNFGTLNLGNLAPSTNAGTLQTLNYKYHIRGGLKGINLDANNNITNNLFSYKLDYEDDGTFYDGNIRKQSWKSNIDGKQRAYVYDYDGASRLKSGIYSSTQAGENYSLNNVNYDASGNIMALSRNGLKSNNNFGLIDNLNYTYNVNSNKILKVDDASNETASFKDVVGNDYDYWQDGSLKKDNNKEITQIDYNYLKLPEQITLTNGRWIKYDYNADGVKLKKTLSTGKVTDYEEDEIYEDGVLYQTTHDEGRIANGIFEYNIVDHLGNLRVAFKDSLGVAKAVQANSYGAFGDDLPTLNYQNTPKLDNFTYSTYEKENDFGIGVFDAHARVYDPINPRFWQIDPLAEISRRFSPYTYANNNPMRFIDPDGMDAVDVNGGVMYTGDDAKNAYIQLQKNRPKEKYPKDEISNLGVSGKFSGGLAMGETSSLLGFKTGLFMSVGTVDIASVQVDLLQGADFKRFKLTDYTISAGIEGGLGIVGASYFVDQNYLTNEKNQQEITQKATTEISIGIASFVSTTTSKIDPKTKQVMKGSEYSQFGLSLFKTEGKVALGYKIEGKANMTFGMMGFAPPIKEQGVMVSDATRINIKSRIKIIKK